jgi:hypothetical protein
MTRSYRLNTTSKASEFDVRMRQEGIIGGRYDNREEPSSCWDPDTADWSKCNDNAAVEGRQQEAGR